MNTIADVTQEGNTKYIVLKPNFYYPPEQQPKRRPEIPVVTNDGQSFVPRGPPSAPLMESSYAPQQQIPVDRRRMVPIHPPEIPVTVSRPRIPPPIPSNIPMNRNQIPDSVMVTAVPYNPGYPLHPVIPEGMVGWNAVPQHPPQPPPRRRSSGSSSHPVPNVPMPHIPMGSNPNMMPVDRKMMMMTPVDRKMVEKVCYRLSTLNTSYCFDCLMTTIIRWLNMNLLRELNVFKTDIIYD